MLTRDQFHAFWAMACELSPENLYCDGERSPAEARRAYQQIMTRWVALEQAVGYRVTEDDIWGPTYAAYRARA